MSAETTREAAKLDEGALRELIRSWRGRAGQAEHDQEHPEMRAYGDALGHCADQLEDVVATAVGGDHKCAFPVQPPNGSWVNPGPCRICGKTYARSQAERQLREAQAAMEAAG